MEVRDYYELLALHRAIMEAKFGDPQSTSDIIGSPLLARVADDVMESLIAEAVKRGDTDARREWEEWRQIDPKRREWPIVAGRIRSISQWLQWSESQRDEVLRHLLSPLKITEQNRQKLLNAAFGPADHLLAS